VLRRTRAISVLLLGVIAVAGGISWFFSAPSEGLSANETSDRPAWMHSAIPNGSWFVYDTLHEEIGQQIHVYLSPIVEVSGGRVRTAVALAVSSRTASVMEGTVVDADSSEGRLDLEVLEISPKGTWAEVADSDDLLLTYP